MKHTEVIDLLNQHIYPFSGASSDYDPLMSYVGEASIVLLGEATHGTHEFYKTRAALTKRLITEKGFTHIAIEGDWPDAFRVNQYINQGTDATAVDALSDFKRFPSWMWRNSEMVTLIEWLHSYNSSQSPHEKVGFYGLDLYSLHQSMTAIVKHLETIDPAAAQKARERYSCFDAFLDPQEYGHFATLYPNESCRKEVIDQLVSLRREESDFYKSCALGARECELYIEQNALVVANAERYYRSMFEGYPAQSWNIRDQHMAETIDALLSFGAQVTSTPKIVVWAHNSHVGDARATQMARSGEINLGQLMRERYGSQVVSVGFSTYTGTVSAASQWSGIVERKFVRPALEGSYEALFHNLHTENFMLFMHANDEVTTLMERERLERAIGVIYLPYSERTSHYFTASLTKQFDVVIHHDTTHALKPLEISSEWTKGELPETYPFGV